jgi:bifunctional NMN adenylyltransferase/nudix hydrolase
MVSKRTLYMKDFHMSQKQYDLVFFIGRQQPTTIPHTKTIVQAFDHGDQVAVLIGSVDIARDPKNPFTFDERRMMTFWAVEDALGLDDAPENFHVFGVRDDLYNNQIWASQVQNIVYNLTGGKKDAKVALIGHKKDASTFYLDMFPEWDFIETPSFGDINATDIRKIIFDVVAKKGWSEAVEAALADMVPESTIKFLKDFAGGFVPQSRYNAIYANLVGEYNYLRHNEEIWKPAPYAHKDVTVDACVIQSGHVLVIRRKRFPGKGLLAMPGGHLEIDEEIEDGMLRELREEVKMKVPEPVIRGSIFAEKCFSHPKRSLRGRIITHAYGILLRNGPLPKLKAADDAAEAFWMPIAEFYRRRDEFFEDHFSMIDYFIKRAS